MPDPREVEWLQTVAADLAMWAEEARGHHGVEECGGPTKRTEWDEIQRGLASSAEDVRAALEALRSNQPEGEPEASLKRAMKACGPCNAGEPRCPTWTLTGREGRPEVAGPDVPDGEIVALRRVPSVPCPDCHPGDSGCETCGDSFVVAHSESLPSPEQPGIAEAIALLKSTRGRCADEEPPPPTSPSQRRGSDPQPLP